MIGLMVILTVPPLSLGAIPGWIYMCYEICVDCIGRRRWREEKFVWIFCVTLCKV